LFLIIANNLQRNGYQVTYYNDFIFQLKDWLPTLSLQPSPNKGAIKQIFSKFDLVISHNNSVIIDYYPASQYSDLAKRCIFITTSPHINKDLIFDHSNHILNKIKNKQKATKLLNLAKASGGCIHDFGNKSPLAERITVFCAKAMGLHNVINDCNLQPPQHLQPRKHPNRIIIHPESGSIIRNWPANKYIKLARLLKNQGWLPVFCLSPDERAKWQTKIANKFLLPNFINIAELAEFIYESGYMIGNDSGIGHLASSLRIPTLTIINKHNHFHWRPNWTIGHTVTPVFKLPLLHRQYWSSLTSVRRVLKAFKNLVSITIA